MAALYRDGNENGKVRVLPSRCAVNAAGVTVEKDCRGVVEGVHFGHLDDEAEGVYLTVCKYAFVCQLFVGGVAVPIIDRGRIDQGAGGRDDEGRIFAVGGYRDGEVHGIQQDLVGVYGADADCLGAHHECGGLGGGIGKGYIACDAFPARKILAVGRLVGRYGDGLSAACLVQIRYAVLHRNGVGGIAVNGLNGHVAGGHDEGGGGCRGVGQDDVFTADDNPLHKCLALLGGIGGDGHGDTAARLGDGGFVNRGVAVFDGDIKALARFHREFHVEAENV